MLLEMSKREQRYLGGHLISQDKIGALEWPEIKAKGRKLRASEEMCVTEGGG